jgi:hypothetical protein
LTLGSRECARDAWTDEAIDSFLIARATALTFWAVNFYLWFAVIGKAFVPLGLYFTALVKSVFITNLSDEYGPHAEQAGIVVMIYAWLLSAIFIYPTYCVFGPSVWLRYAFLVYIGWYLILDRRAPASGKRFIPLFRRLPFWRVLSEYFHRCLRIVDVCHRSHGIFLRFSRAGFTFAHAFIKL